MTRWPLPLVLAAVLAAGAPASGDELERADEQVAELEDELSSATDAYERAWAELEHAREELARLEGRAEELRAEAEEVERRLGRRARRVFKRGATAQLQALLTAEGVGAAIDRAALLEAVQLRESASLEGAVATREALDQTEAMLAEQTEELEELESQLEERAEALEEQLADAEQHAHDLRTLDERQQRIERGEQQGIYSCIFESAYRFRDTWGAPRSGGRSHKGTDVFAPMGHPVYAFTSGTIARHSSGGLGGIAVYLQGDDGNLYYYAHLSGIDESAAVGTRVDAGELIATNGASGNASASAPHVHFELHPGGGAAINPYPWLQAACY